MAQGATEGRQRTASIVVSAWMEFAIVGARSASRTTTRLRVQERTKDVAVLYAELLHHPRSLRSLLRTKMMTVQAAKDAQKHLLKRVSSVGAVALVVGGVVLQQKTMETQLSTLILSGQTRRK